MRGSVWSTKLAYLYIAPAMIAMALITFYPIVYGFYISFTNFSIYHYTDYKFIGFKNFIKILFDIDTDFYRVLGWTVVWTAVNVFLHVTVGVFLALLLNSKYALFPRVYRAIFILPWAVPSFITALIWQGMFNKEFGAINQMLKMVGIGPIPWLSDPFWAKVAVIITNVWLGIPFMMVVASGALQSIPRELYEAAEVDGCSEWDKLRFVTLPLIRPAMVPAVILGIIWTFNQFNVIWLVTGGGPAGATDILITYAYKAAFEKWKYGYASAFSVIIFFMLVAINILNLKVTKALKGVYD